MKILNQKAVAEVTKEVKAAYELEYKGEVVRSVTGRIIKSDQTCGYFNLKKGGVFGFSLLEDHALTEQEIRKAFSKVMDDCYSSVNAQE